MRSKKTNTDFINPVNQPQKEAQCRRLYVDGEFWWRLNDSGLVDEVEEILAAITFQT